MKLPGLLQGRILKEALTALFKGPYTADFPKKPSEPQKRYRGKAKYDEAGCVGCGACAMVCPANDIQISDDPTTRKRTITLYYDKCIQCGQCEANCITKKGITLTPDFNTVFLDRREAKTGLEKDLVICEKCGDVVGAADHIRWVADRLGPLAYSNPTLMLTALKDAKLVKDAPPREAGVEAGRQDVIRILCPRCRREVQLKA
jgi:formate hydrogenlyase subunit 6/NADH:ubiquinone oxidoreductase subunit I